MVDKARLESLQGQASASFLKGDFGSAVAAWQQILAVVPSDETALEGIRLCEQWNSADEQPVSAQPTDPTHPAHSIPVSSENLDVLDLTGPEPVPPATDPPPGPQAEGTVFEWGGGDGKAAPAEDSAMAELRRRVDDLLADAHRSMEIGNHEDALSAVERVLILDEDNQAAAGIRAQVLEGQGLGSQESIAIQPLDLAEVAAPDLDLSGALDAPADGPLVATPPLVDGPVAAELAQPAEMEPARAEAPAGSAELRDVPSDEPVSPAGKAGLAARLALTPKVMIAVGAVLVLGLAFGAWKMLGSGSEEALNEPSALDLQVQQQKQVQKTDRPTVEAPTTDAAAPAEAAQALLVRAEEAFRAEDYGTALIAYDQLLGLHPENTELKRRMELSAERYKAQQVRTERWQNATRSWESSNFREALKVLYRMPDEDPEHIGSLIAAGWYNLGVESLRRSDCRGASAHLAEAEQTRPDDEGILAAIEMTHDCGRIDAKDFRLQVATLELRPID